MKFSGFPVDRGCGLGDRGLIMCGLWLFFSCKYGEIGVRDWGLGDILGVRELGLGVRGEKIVVLLGLW